MLLIVGVFLIVASYVAAGNRKKKRQIMRLVFHLKFLYLHFDSIRPAQLQHLNQVLLFILRKIAFLIICTWMENNYSLTCHSLRKKDYTADS